jgi:hypothetical protein
MYNSVFHKAEGFGSLNGYGEVTKYHLFSGQIKQVPQFCKKKKTTVAGGFEINQFVASAALAAKRHSYFKLYGEIRIFV